MGVEILAKQIQNIEEDRIAHRVVDLVAGLAVHEHLFGPEDGEVLGEVGLLDLKQLHQTAGGQLAVAERFDDGDAGGMRERLKDLRLELAQHVLVARHSISILEVSNIRNMAKITGLKRRLHRVFYSAASVTLGSARAARSAGPSAE